MLALYGDLLPPIQAQDNEIIAAPLDYLGINIYRRSVIAAGDELAPLSYRRVQPEGLYSAVDYEIWPRCMYDILHYVNDRYAPPAIYISENGVATKPETVGEDGCVWDVCALPTTSITSSRWPRRRPGVCRCAVTSPGR